MSPDGLRLLAAMVRAGMSPRRAAAGWQEVAAPADRPAARAAGRVLALGGDLHEALRVATGDDETGAVAGLIARVGGDLPAALDELAEAAERDEAMRKEAHLAASGALLSGRLMTWLPLGITPFLPAGAGGKGPLGLLLMACGAALVGAGMWRIRSFVPRVPPPEPARTLALLVAAAVAAGVALPVALREACLAAQPPFDDVLRAVRLGASWPEAFASRSDRGSRELAQVLRIAVATGAPVAPALRGFVGRCAAAQQRALQLDARRAPVRMMVPLALLVLPGFALVALGPLLAVLAGG